MLDCPPKGTELFGQVLEGHTMLLNNLRNNSRGVCRKFSKQGGLEWGKHEDESCGTLDKKDTCILEKHAAESDKEVEELLESDVTCKVIGGSAARQCTLLSFNPREEDVDELR